MNNRAYTLIFILLSCCIFFILAIQGYWIRNFYMTETGAFNRNVYATLGKLDTKLQERKSLQALKTTYFIVNDDTLAKTPSHNTSIKATNRVRIMNQNDQQVETISLQSGNTTHTIKDSVIISGKDTRVNIVMHEKGTQLTATQSSIEKLMADGRQLAEEGSEMTKLIDKMITEIHVLDAGALSADTLAGLIKRTLAQQGLFLPFEFSLQKIDPSKKEILAQSHHFSEQLPAYKSDLSANKVISTHEYLFLQFPGQNKFVLAGMKGSLGLSLFFSLLILGVFYYVLRLLLRQKKLSEIKNDFVNNMTHELKTPIATISLALDGISHPVVKNDPGKFEEYTRILKEENQKLNRHVERVLQMALLDKGELQLHRQPVNLVTIIHNAIHAYALQIQKQQATVSFFPPADHLPVDADELHLTNVFSNLLDNALKYCSGNCLIQIAITKENGRLIVSFKDNGIGIDAAAKEKVFEKFYRVQGGNLHDVKGFGLGLSYVRSIVEAHGGTIALNSEKQKGSEFIISLNAYAG